MGGRVRAAAWTAAILVTVCLQSPADASWPMARHDAKRVGVAAGTSNLQSPIPYWRVYLGGAIEGTQLLVAPISGSGTPNLIFATSGQIVAKDATDATLWKTAANNAVAFAGIADLDGDGVEDVVAYSGNQVIIVSVKTGAIEWTEPVGEMGTIGSVRVGDVSGDGKPDVLVTECGCCGVNSGNSGFYWSFGNGFGNAAHLGTLPIFTCGTSISVTLLQADASSRYETLLADSSHFALLDGSGNVLAQTAALGNQTEASRCAAADIDGVPGDEAVCLLNSSDPPATNERRITVMHYNYAAQPATLDVLWSNVVAPDTGGDMRWVDPVVDLDGDGTFEVVVSTQDPTNGWETHVYDALTGTDLIAPIAGEIVQGTAAMTNSKTRILLTKDAATQTTVSGWSFSSQPTFQGTKAWSVPNAGVLNYPVMGLVSLGSVNTRAVATDLNGDGVDDLVLKVLSSTAPPGLLGYSGAGGNVQQIASLNLPSDVDVLSTWIVPGVTTTTPQVSLARTDGFLNLLDGHLGVANAGKPANPVSVRIGGYYANGAWREVQRAPRTARLGMGAAESIVVSDSRQALLRFDPTSASMAVPPIPSWEVTHTFAPAIAPSLDGTNPAMGCLALKEPVTTPPTYMIRVVRTDGTVAWQQPLSGTPENDPVPGNFDGDPTPDLVLQLGDSSDVNIVTTAFSGANGSTLWSTAPSYPGPGGWQSAGVSVGGWSGGSLDDVAYQGAATYVLDGSNGNQLATGGPTNAYSLPILFDTDGDGQDEVTLTAGFWPVSLYSHDLKTALWTSSDSDRPYPYGAITQCGAGGGPLLVEGSLQNPARLKFTPLSGTNIGAYNTIVLASGKAYPTEAAAMAAGATLGQLTSANVHANLTGQQHPTAVVGSSDGWLYGVNPCAATLDFAVNLGSPVGEAVFGDTDGDGNDEIITTAADGYLYDLKNDAIAAPSYVWDTDPDHGITNTDVNDIVTTNKLSATWGSVIGATGYQVAIVDSGDKIITTPAWRDVGTMTSTSVTGLPLSDGHRYFFAVRAMSASGPSVDIESNGVVVHVPENDGGVVATDSGPPDASNDAPEYIDAGKEGSSAAESGGQGGCGCRLAAASSHRSWPGLPTLGILVALLLRRRGKLVVEK